jgi:hypothetical protein
MPRRSAREERKQRYLLGAFLQVNGLESQPVLPTRARATQCRQDKQPEVFLAAFMLFILM